MRQAGIIAAGGIYALENNISRLAEDHENADLLKKLFSEIDRIEIISADTNMVFCRFENCDLPALTADLKKEGIIIMPMGKEAVRFVTHINISEEDVVKLADSVKKYFA